MADAHKAPGQHMHGKAADELHARQRHHLFGCWFPVVLVSKADCVLVHCCEAVVGDGDLVGAAAQVLHHRLWSCKDSLGIHHPLFSEQGINQLPVHPRQAILKALTYLARNTRLMALAVFLAFALTHVEHPAVEVQVGKADVAGLEEIISRKKCRTIAL